MAKGERWKPGCGWGAQVESLTMQAARHHQFWQDVLDKLVTQHDDESVTLRCENGPWKGDSFRIYPPEVDLVLGPITYVVSPPTEGRPTKGSVSPKKAYHLTVKGT